jgi:xanthine dehydrogenase accessory factor
MRDILPDLEAWRQRGEQIAIATVVETWGSSPRPVGSKLAMTLSGGIAGSVSAGCVENAVIEEARDAIRTGKPRLLTFGVSKETALDVGLTCGGTIKVFVEPFTAYTGIYDLLKPRIEAHEPMGVIEVLEGPSEYLNQKLAVFADGHIEGDLALPAQLEDLRKIVLDRLARQGGGVVELSGLQLFIDIYLRTPRLIIIGAVHIAEFLVAMASLAGFDLTIIDPRSAFASPERFPNAVTLIKQWPEEALTALKLDETSYVAALSHDQKLDDPALRVALASKAVYVGALGSKRSNLLRLKRLQEAGLSETQLARLHSPIGLPLGGRNAVEIAISILAQIIQVRNNRDQ